MGSVPCTVFVAASCSFEEFVENWTGKATSCGVITRACGSEFSCDIDSEADGSVGTAPERFSCEGCSKNPGCAS